MIAAASSIYFIFLRRQSAKQLIKPSLTVLALAAVAILISAAQLFPTAELVLNSSRGPAGDFDIQRANQYSYPLYHLPTLLFPRFFDTDNQYWGKRLEIEHGFFIGTIPLILAFYAMTILIRAPHPMSGSRRLRVARLGGPPTSARSEARTSGGGRGATGPVADGFLIALVLISFLLALGSLSPFRLIGLEPSLWVFTAPSRWLLFTSFGLAIFAAFGFDQLRASAGTLPKLIKWSAPIIITLVLLGNAALFIDQQVLADWVLNQISAISPDALSGRPSIYYQDKILSLFNSARYSSLSLQSPYTWLTLVSLVSLPYLIKHRAFNLVLVIVSMELVAVASAATPTISWREILSPPASLNQLPANVTSGQARLYSIRRDDGDTGAFLTNPATRADANQRAQYQQLLIPLVHSQFNIAGIEWPASLSLAGHTQQLTQLRGEGGYEVSNTELAQSFNIGAILKPDQFGQSITVTTLNPSPRADADYQQISPTQVQFTPSSDQTEINILNSHYPGWQATTAGQLLPISKVNNIFQQIIIPTGSTSINLAYKPASIYIGSAFSALALLTCGILLYSKSKP